MREILFRGKTIENKSKWVEGFYNHIPRGIFQCDDHCIQTIDKDGRIGLLYHVYDSTVGQYTGLTDKNGKKIFEGDIVKATEMDDRDLCGEVAFDYMSWCVQGRNWSDTLYMAYDCHDIEVVGNIHDNPELLEV